VQGQTMGKTLTRLEANGHVVRERSHADRRSQRISISEQGLLALGEASRFERLLNGDEDGQGAGLDDRLAVIIRRSGNTRFNIQAPRTP
jgi:MarR family transcriptional regulator, organic hydroperoxide resistance regulator